MISGFHPEDPGSTPGCGTFYFWKFYFLQNLKLRSVGGGGSSDYKLEHFWQGKGLNNTGPGNFRKQSKV